MHEKGSIEKREEEQFEREEGVVQIRFASGEVVVEEAVAAGGQSGFVAVQDVREEIARDLDDDLDLLDDLEARLG